MLRVLHRSQDRQMIFKALDTTVRCKKTGQTDLLKSEFPRFGPLQSQGSKAWERDGTRYVRGFGGGRYGVTLWGLHSFFMFLRFLS